MNSFLQLNADGQVMAAILKLFPCRGYQASGVTVEVSGSADAVLWLGTACGKEFQANKIRIGEQQYDRRKYGYHTGGG